MKNTSDNGDSGGGMRSDPYRYEGVEPVDLPSSSMSSANHIAWKRQHIHETSGVIDEHPDVHDECHDEGRDVSLVELPEFCDDPLKSANSSGINYRNDNDIFISGVILEDNDHAYDHSSRGTPSPSDRRDNDLLLGRSSSTAGWGWKPIDIESSDNKHGDDEHGGHPTHRRLSLSQDAIIGRRNSYLTYYIWILLGVIFTAMAVAIVVLEEEKSKAVAVGEAIASGTSSPTKLDFNATRDQMIPISGTDPLFDTTSVPYQALEWLVANYGPKMEVADVHETYVITVLYFTTNGKQWNGQANFLDSSVSICDWNIGPSFGVHCNKVHSVIRISLERCNLQGSIPHELFYLSNIEIFEVGTNQLAGTIPKEIVSAVKMERFSINNNEFTGTIPVQISQLKHLERLDIEHNSISGTIPSELGFLTKLQNLQIKDNFLEGPIPSGLGNIPYLEVLTVAENSLTGTVPPEIGNLNLKRVELEKNDIVGDIDPIFCTGNSSSEVNNNNIIIKADSCHSFSKVTCGCCCCSRHCE